MTLTLANPDALNAQVPSLWTALAEVGGSLPADCRVVVIRGEGRAFSAGLNRAMFSPGGVPGEGDLMSIVGDTLQSSADAIEAFQAGFAVWRRVPQIVVAAVQGHAIGAGFQLALAADLRVVADDVQLAMREVTLGIVPDLGGTGTLVHLVGYSRALELCATGRTVGAEEAMRLGLATLAVPRADLDAATADLVAALLAVPAPALAAVKPLLVHAIAATPEDQLRREREVQAGVLSGIRAALRHKPARSDQETRAQ